MGFKEAGTSQCRNLPVQEPSIALHVRRSLDHWPALATIGADYLIDL